MHACIGTHSQHTLFSVLLHTPTLFLPLLRICTCTHTRIHAYARDDEHACVVKLIFSLYNTGSIHAALAYTYTYMHTYTHAHIHTSIQSHTYYMHTYIHT